MLVELLFALLLPFGLVVLGEDCVTLYTKGGTRSPEPCVFPFTFRGQPHSSCIPPLEGDYEGLPWCSVEVNSTGHHLLGRGRWGHCDPTKCGTEQVPN